MRLWMLTLCVIQLAMSPPALLALWVAAVGSLDAATAAGVEAVKVYAAGPSPANTPWLPFVSSLPQSPPHHPTFPSNIWSVYFGTD